MSWCPRSNVYSARSSTPRRYPGRPHSDSSPGPRPVRSDPCRIGSHTAGDRGPHFRPRETGCNAKQQRHNRDCGRSAASRLPHYHLLFPLQIPRLDPFPSPQTSPAPTEEDRQLKELKELQVVSRGCTTTSTTSYRRPTGLKEKSKEHGLMGFGSIHKYHR